MIHKMEIRREYRLDGDLQIRTVRRILSIYDDEMLGKPIRYNECNIVLDELSDDCALLNIRGEEKNVNNLEDRLRLPTNEPLETDTDFD